jgi:hypothetical protein
MVIGAIETIRCDLLCAVERLANVMVEKGGGLSKTTSDKLLAGVDDYVTKLKKVALAKPMGMKTQFKIAKDLVLFSYNARFYAALRAALRRGRGVTLDEIHAITKKLDVWKAFDEPVVVRWTKKGGKLGYRPIVVSGILRTAQSLMLRDILLMFDIDSAVDFTTKGGGGEKALIRAVCNDIEDGYHWWWNPDIKDCFGSITPRHLGWLAIDRRLIRNIAFLPKCAKIVVPDHKDEEAILKYLYGKHSDLSEGGNTSLHDLTVRIVRRGLLQGSVLSPLLARAEINRELAAALCGKEWKRYSFCDDLSIGAQTRGECLAAKQAVADHLSSLPAGPIELHAVKTRDAKAHRILVLGYALEAGNGYGDNYVHVKPWVKRIERFKQNLLKKLKAAPADANHFEIAEKYRVQWFGSQAAWTKVPFFSNDVSQAITEFYVQDFHYGIPMGVWKLNVPPGVPMPKKLALLSKAA